MPAELSSKREEPQASWLPCIHADWRLTEDSMTPMRVPPAERMPSVPVAFEEFSEESSAVAVGTVNASAVAVATATKREE
ncbi:hypothetical protein HMPREF2976_09220 [Corynebacterium sp. HMSC077D10]|nr:hypothetical protein HMPREF2748_05360 [Corynebacterium sp. HMSC077B05]OFP19162.1 hypothetical protein HMPREF2998_10725 [Corynebacterium sp. HMSC065A05]OFP67902.1 hypothetical protein HMPREF2976_09220 [Corynebacterium sp. HMSC077D10]